MDTFARLLVVGFLVTMMGSFVARGDEIKAEFQRIDRRLKLVEDSLAKEGLSRRKDVDGLMDKLSRIEELLEKSSGRRPANQDLIRLQQEKDPSVYIDKNEITRLMRSVKHAFSTEKKLNMRLRREIIEKLNDQELLKNMIEGMLEKMKDNVIKNMVERFSAMDKTLHNSVTPLSSKLEMSQTCLSQYTENAVKKSDLQELNENCLKDLVPLNDIQEITKDLVTKSELYSLTVLIQDLKSEFEPHIVKSRSCKELYDRGFKKNGVHDIYLNTRPIQVYCNQETDGGGWTVFQRRQDGSVDFYRNWDDYKKGFGNLEGEFWLGNDYITELTMDCCHELRVDIEDFKGNVAYAKYSTFIVGPESSMYKLEVDGFSGNASDSLKYHNGMEFSTKDSDNDLWVYGNCAAGRKGAWWYNYCHDSNLNGKYRTGGVISDKGINWYYWKKNKYSYKFSEMKLR